MEIEESQDHHQVPRHCNFQLEVLQPVSWNSPLVCVFMNIFLVYCAIKIEWFEAMKHAKRVVAHILVFMRIQPWKAAQLSYTVYC